MSRKTREDVPKRLARDAVVLSDVSHRNPRAYDRRKKQRTAAGIVDLC
jgi:hypothetical protein